MDAIRLPNGNLLVPLRAEGPDGIIGDTQAEVGPGDPEYVRWMDYYQRVGRQPLVKHRNGRVTDPNPPRA